MWFTNGWNLVDTPTDSGFTVVEVEGSNDLRGILASHQQLPLEIPRAIITDFNGLIVKDGNGVTDIPVSQAIAKPLIDAGFDLITESYLATDNGTPTGRTPDTMHSVAVQLGWTKSQPAFGLFGGKTIADYDQWKDWPGNCDYLAEYAGVH